MSPRNSSGTYSLPSPGVPFQSGQVLNSTHMNATLADLGNEISDSLSKSGKGGATQPIRGANGGQSAPTFAFTSEPSSGMYLFTPGDLRLAIGGVDFVTPNGISFTGSAGFGPVLTTTVAGKSVTLLGNLAAASGAADVQIGSTATRTAGFIAAFQNPINAGNKLLVDYNGLLTLANQAASIQPASLWTAITPNAGWGAFSGLGFWKDATGTVRCKGAAQFTTGAGAAVFTLPAGFRPIADRTLIGLDTTAAGTVPVIVYVAATGVVSILGTTLTNAHIYSMDSVSFLAEQ